MARKTFLKKLLGQYFDHILSFELSSDLQRQAFPTIFIDQGQDPQRPAIMSPVGHKVIRPDVSLVIEMPAFTNQKLLNPSVSIASVTAGKFNGSLSQFFIEFTIPGFIPSACPVP